MSYNDDEPRLELEDGSELTQEAVDALFRAAKDSAADEVVEDGVEDGPEGEAEVEKGEETVEEETSETVAEPEVKEVPSVPKRLLRELRLHDRRDRKTCACCGVRRHVNEYRLRNDEVCLHCKIEYKLD